MVGVVVGGGDKGAKTTIMVHYLRRWIMWVLFFGKWRHGRRRVWEALLLSGCRRLARASAIAVMSPCWEVPKNLG